MPLLIDGHNLIGQLSDIDLADPNDETKLLGRLQSYHRLTREPITVVFDPGDVQGVGRPRPTAGVTVIYAVRGEDADAVLIRRIERDRAPRRLTVVSSDRRVIGVAQANGAIVVKAPDFARTLAERLNPTPQVAPSDDKPTTTSEDVDYWMGIFKEPVKKQKGNKGTGGTR